MYDMQLKEGSNLAELGSGVVIEQIKDKAEKLKYMQSCDSAYTISVLERDNFIELFEKIHQKAIFLGLKYNSKRAGYVAFYANDIENKIAFITLICVAKEFQRLHLGAALMNKCIEIVKMACMKKIKLEVLKVDTHAIEFYKSVGFKIEKDFTVDSICMCKDL